MDTVVILLLMAIGVIALGQLFMIIGMNKKLNTFKQILGVSKYDEKEPPPPLPPPPPPQQPKEQPKK